MADLFFIVLRMSLLAALAALIVLPLRWLFRRMRAPAWLCVALWLAVLLRMAVPFQMFTTEFSLTTWSTPVVQEQIEVISQALQEEERPSSVLASYAPPEQNTRLRVVDVLPWAWAAGVLAFWGYGVLSVCKLRLRLKTAVRRGEGETQCWESDRIPAPFVFGLFRPKIYVPAGLEGDPLDWVLRHERAHLRLGHHWLKPLFFLALGLHWFNPVLWLAWKLFCVDLEVQCDEAVLKRATERTAYSSALLSLAAPRQGLTLPPGFGELDVKDRIKRALRYRKPAKWAVAAAALLAVLLVVYLAADPVISDTVTFDLEHMRVRYPGETRWTDLVLPEAEYNTFGELRPRDFSKEPPDPIFVLEELPEASITLYAVDFDCPNDGVLLRSGNGCVQYFPGVRFCSGPRWMGAELCLADFDGDAVEELAAAIGWGGGTGVSTANLYLFEPAQEGFVLSDALEDEVFEWPDSSLPQNKIVGLINHFIIDENRISVEVGICDADWPVLAHYVGDLVCSITYDGKNLEMLREQAEYIPYE